MVDWIIIVSTDTLPPVNTEVLGYSKEWIDEDYNLDGIRLCYMADLIGEENSGQLWFSAGWCGYHDEWHTLSSDDIDLEEMQIPRTPPTHWMHKPIPPIN